MEGLAIARGANQKLKLLYLYKILVEQTDENTTLNAGELIRELERYGVSAERKSIYDDIEALRLFGLDVNISSEHGRGYYVGERHFQVSEIKMLIDIVQAAKFISENKSVELIKKISSLAPVTDRKALNHQIVVANRVKSANETVYYSIDHLYRAIEEKRQVKFRYYTWDVRKNKLYKNKGQFYYVNPISLMWAEEKYYLVAYDEFSAKIKHYRVDKMENVEVCGEYITRNVREMKFDAADYAKRSFNMFGGETREVTLCGNLDSIGIIFDRFGRDVFVVPQEDGSFNVTVKVAVSPQFYSWVFGVSDLLKIVYPQDIVDKYCNMCRNIINDCKK
ncbi:MAG: WYL domain-containing protein [Clostridia bacterium]|nr:WYL domain-containing protein [Clostridia bacterium]